ncbi:hypothetical protein LB941_11265 [Ligilactobacillus sp. WILCCON 0076]|uniref:FtsK domain-containing protein n=1 Tax=Ligilactobacillus ubinensis TaxID=2876789 RepID=A0A9X2JMH1_9LACO|nr:FtsK/SpoIIIE domain-containing protein [Ligilactobacillus ubinensis]MCP0887909.1 hypothetical protein [Ligilactobacillus ubinensis]
MIGFFYDLKNKREQNPIVISLNERSNYLDYPLYIRIITSIFIVFIIFFFTFAVVSDNLYILLFDVIVSLFLIKKIIYFKKSLEDFCYKQFYFEILLLQFLEDIKDLELSFVYQLEEDGTVLHIVANKGVTNIEKHENLEKGLSSVLNLPFKKKTVGNSVINYFFEIQKPKRLVVKAKEKLEFTDKMDIDLGYGIVYNPVRTPHVLIGGGTGSGKTIFISFFLIELMKRHSTVYICDPKNSDLGNLSHYLDDHVAVTPNNIARVTRLAVEEMKKRYSIMNDPMNFKYGSNFVDHGFNSLWLIFDEMGAFQASATDKEGKKIVDEVMSNIKHIILLGRQAGCFILVAAQQMSASSALSTDLRDNLGLRIALGNNSPDGLRMIFNTHMPASLPDVSVKGSGLIYVESTGKMEAEYWEAPFVDTTSFNFIEELLKYKTADKYGLE